MNNIISGNWKMFKTVKETEQYFNDLLPLIKETDNEVIIFTPFTSLSTALDCVKSSNIKIGAQNMHYENEGAFTGEISAQMLDAIGINTVLVGHSERREYFNELNFTVNKKVVKALENGFKVIMCVGENLEQRKSSQTFDWIESQIVEGLAGIQINENLVIAYEPIWAIGTGETATSVQAEEVCAFIRKKINSLYGDISNEIRILYGGSVKPSNIKEIMSMDNINGVLVGGASLNSDFKDIINFDK